MRKNTAGQTVGAQMITAADGSAFTGAVTVAVTGDGGTQATGTVGAGACTHEGSGFHTYTPAQAETNFDHVAFTFTGTGAIPVTVQIYTSFPQTGDSFARIGAGGVSLNDIPWHADWDAEVQSEVADALAAYDPPTNAEMEARTIASASYATAANLAIVAAFLDTEVAAILEDTGTTIPALIAALNNLDAAGIRTAVGLATANLDTQLGDLPTNAELAARTLLAAAYATAANQTSIEADTQDIQSRLPASLNNGVMPADMQRINDVALTGDGGVGTEFSV